MAWYCKRNKALMVFKIDFEKAFDSLRWDYLDVIMEKLGEWSHSNAYNLIRLVRCFYMVSGLNINVHNSKILGVNVFDEDVSSMKSLESMRNRFFIGGDSDDKKITWVNWNSCLASKAMGSLGIGSIFALNVSLLFEWVWRFRTTSNSLWVNVIKDIHGHDGGIESGRAGKLSHSPWNSIIRTVSHLQAKVIDLFALCGRSVGDGNSISFWGDNWFAQRINIEDWSFVLRRPPRCGVEWNQLDELIQVTRDVVHSADGWNWELDTTGYLVASARIHIDEHTLNGTFTSTRWLRCIPIKVNVFIWRLRLDKLLTL
nr:hypothetical protein [Tanacetum cinerariifolium]